MHKKSISLRVITALFSTAFRTILGFLTGILLARGLGPESYGRMAFLLGLFMGIRRLIDMGSSSAFFTFLSKKSRSRFFYVTYFQWTIVQLALVLFVVFLIIPERWFNVMWHGEAKELVVLAVLAAFMQSHVWPIATQLGESQRLTRFVQYTWLSISLVHFSVVLALWWMDHLNIKYIFISIIVQHVLATLLFAGKLEYSNEPENSNSIRNQIKDYAKYCLPLVPYSIVGFAYDFADRWLLQTYAGAIQQAYYSISLQYATFAVIITTTLINIFWKEISEAHHQGNKSLAEDVYNKFSRLSYISTAGFACFLIPWVPSLLENFLGSRYADARVSLVIMLIYIIQFSAWQVNSVVFLAIGRTDLHAKTGIVFMLISIVSAWIAIAPSSGFFPGLALGAVGLASKMLIIQTIQTITVSVIISRVMGWKIQFSYQLILLGITSAASYISFALSSLLHSKYYIVTIAFGFVLYTGVISVLLYFYPSLVLSTREQFHALVRRLFQIPDPTEVG